MMSPLKIRRKYLFYTLAIASSIISSITVGFDAIIISELSAYFDVNEVSWIYCFNIFLIGFVVSVIFAVIFSVRLKKRSLGSVLADPSFERLRMPTKEELKYQMLAGLGNAVSTVGYFYVLSTIVDPTAVVPFFRVVILYLLIVEMVVEKNAPTLIEIQSSVIVTIGAILGSISISGKIDVLSLLVVFLVINPGWVIFSIFQRKLKLIKINGKPNDSINIRVWNVFFSFIFIAIMMFIQDRLRNTSYLATSFEGCLKILDLLFISTTLVFFAYIFYIRALGMGKASITEAVRASIVIFSLPVAAFISHIISVPMPSSPTLWLLKAMGIVLVVLGILSFALAQITAYIFIKAKDGVSIEKLMEEVWRIRGVESVSAVTGKYDIIAKVRIRTLPKGYERIIRKLEAIPEIAEFRWQSVLKEWSAV